MSINELHDLLRQLKEQAVDLSLDETEHQQYLTEIIESLEDQILVSKGISDDSINQPHLIITQIEEIILHYEAQHPAIAAVLGSVMNTLKGMGI